MTALLISSILLTVLSVASSVLITVLSFKASSRAFQTLDSMQARHVQQVDVLLDRLVAIDWEKFAVLKSMQDPEVGGFFEPGSDEEDEKSSRGGEWGSLSTLRERTRLTADEERLLAEDFPDLGGESS